MSTELLAELVLINEDNGEENILFATEELYGSYNFLVEMSAGNYHFEMRTLGDLLLTASTNSFFVHPKIEINLIGPEEGAQFYQEESIVITWEIEITHGNSTQLLAELVLINEDNGEEDILFATEELYGSYNFLIEMSVGNYHFEMRIPGYPYSTNSSNTFFVHSPPETFVIFTKPTTLSIWHMFIPQTIEWEFIDPKNSIIEILDSNGNVLLIDDVGNATSYVWTPQNLAPGEHKIRIRANDNSSSAVSDPFPISFDGSRIIIVDDDSVRILESKSVHWNFEADIQNVDILAINHTSLHMLKENIPNEGQTTINFLSLGSGIYEILVRNTNNHSQYGVSNKIEVTEDKTINIVIDDDSVRIYDSITINWSSEAIIPAVDILAINSTRIHSLENEIINTGSANITFESIAQGTYKVVVRNSNNHSQYGISNVINIIEDRSITILDPIWPTIWYNGLNYTIYFNTTGDISQVRAYLDSAADEAAKQIGASAYAEGRSIHFKSDFSPGNYTLRLVAHEAVHIVQQGSSIEVRERAITNTTVSTTPTDENNTDVPTTDANGEPTNDTVTATVGGEPIELPLYFPKTFLLSFSFLSLLIISKKKKIII
jgi:hypothetical protein